MDIKQSVITCLRDKYADFNGRAGRPEFWWFALAQVLAIVITGVLSGLLSNLVALGLLVPGLAVGARRLHDIGKSGWWMLIALIPLIGALVLIYWAVQPGESGANAYGEPLSSAAVPEVAPGQQ